MRIGFFVVLGLLCCSVGVFLIGKQNFRFKRTYTLKTEFRNVQGLNNGAEVRVGGIHEGTIREILLPADPNGKLTVIMDLDSDTNSLIKKDSIATIKTEGLLGDKYIEIAFGSIKSPEVADNDTIAGEVPKDFAEQASAVTDQAKTAVAAFQTNMEALQNNFLLRGFFEKRGYNDSSELTRDAVNRMPKDQPAQNFKFDAKDLFDKPDNAKLKNAKKLEAAGKYLEENNFKLAIVAASATVGDSKEDRTLTKARAKVVRDYLVHNFKIDDAHLKTIGLGKKADDSDRSGSISILIYANSESRKKE
jgi:outer membrane protein OmpA-like peptidoglycan-associated protein